MEQHEASALDRPGTILIRVARGDGALLEGDGRPSTTRWCDLRPPRRYRPGSSGRGPSEHGSRSASWRSPRRALRARRGGFGRHTFLCGQSGSGKTYSLGVLLEQLLMQTSLRVVVLDPNSDYVRLGELSTEADDESVERYRAAAGRSRSQRNERRDSIRVRLRDLSPAHQAAFLRLDPVADRGEYAELLALVEDKNVRSLEDLARSPAEALKLRARNLGVDRWGIWPGPGGSRCPRSSRMRRRRAASSWTSGRCRPRGAGGRGRSGPREALEAARRREPVAIVIDEAHNVCPAEPGDQLTALTTADAIRIAGEGRKFGLYLIVVTQRPQKVHENVLSQCDNLVLMRMNSIADLGHVARVFSSVPTGLIDRADDIRTGRGARCRQGRLASSPDSLRLADQPGGRGRRGGLGLMPVNRTRVLGEASKASN